jgi:hypothetical protein
MDAGTYPSEKVAEYIDKHYVPIQVNIKEDPGAMDRFHTMWTPTLMMKDDRGREYRRSEGFLNPPELLAELSLGRLRAALGREDYVAAVKIAEDALKRSEFDSNRHAEARYWSGVAEYKNSNDAAKLGEQWKQLLREAPNSIWARKAPLIK